MNENRLRNTLCDPIVGSLDGFNLLAPPAQRSKSAKVIVLLEIGRQEAHGASPARHHVVLINGGISGSI
jgi:hypothetical protein